MDPDGHHLHLVEGDIGVLDDSNEGEDGNGNNDSSQVKETHSSDNNDGRKVSLPFI